MKPGRFFSGLLLGIFLGGTAVLLVARFPKGAVQPSSGPAETSQSFQQGKVFKKAGGSRKSLPTVDTGPDKSPKRRDNEPGQAPYGLGKAETREVRVTQVIDGDTIIIRNGESVRIVGIDTPEREEPFYSEARDLQQEKVLGKIIRLHACEKEPRDRYGRLLAFVEVGGEDVGIELLLDGLARTLFVGSCGLARAKDYRAHEREAFRAGRGIWSLQNPRRVDHAEAARYVGWLMTVTGKVKKVYAGPRAIHLNFGKNHRKDFTAVIFRKDLSRLSEQGLKLPVTGYEGKRVEITGTLKEYNGPEVIIQSADQIALSSSLK